MREPREPPENGRFVPMGVVNWYEVHDYDSPLEQIVEAFANPVNGTVLTIENVVNDHYVVNVLPYDDWETVTTPVEEVPSVHLGRNVVHRYAEEHVA